MDDYASRETADLVRGSAIAVALVALVVLAYAIIANSRLWQQWTAPKRIRVTVAPRAAPEDYAPHLHPMGSDYGSAGGSAGAPADEPGGAGASVAPVTGPPAAGGAAEALREALKNFRLDATRTTTISISSSGRTRLDGRGGLTAIDGLPMDSVRGAIVLSGSGPSARPAPAP